MGYGRSEPIMTRGGHLNVFVTLFGDWELPLVRSTSVSSGDVSERLRWVVAEVVAGHDGWQWGCWDGG